VKTTDEEASDACDIEIPNDAADQWREPFA
jgi:hypothetical protein